VTETNVDIRDALVDMVARANYSVKKFNSELDYLEDHQWLSQFYELMTTLKASGQVGVKNDANSYVAWAIGVTSVKPLDDDQIKPLIKGSMPDVDIDFEPRKRNLVFEFIQSKYGGYRIGTFAEQSDKAVLRMVSRVFEVPPAKINELSKNLETLEELRGTDDAQLKNVLKYSLVYRGLNGGLGTHAAGVVATQAPMPVRVDKNGDFVTQYDKKGLELLNAVKFDILNVAYIDVLADMFNLTKNHYDTINYEDKDVYASMLKTTVGVFQLESDGMRKLLTDIKPDSFEELAALLALFRPGPIKAGLTNYFAAGKWGKGERLLVPPAFDEILSKTYNVLVYQEQIIKICQKVGYTATEADSFRRVIGSVREDTQDELKQFLLDARAEFEAKALANGVDIFYEDESGSRHSYYDVIEKMAGYSFNKSHSISYARISYICSYFKLYHPVLYILCLLNVFPDKLEDIINSGAVTFLPPDVNKSKNVLVQEGDALRLPLSFIKGCGPSVVDAILENQPYGTVDDFKNRMCAKGSVKVKKNVLTLLEEYGAMESLGIKGIKQIDALKRSAYAPYFLKYTSWETADVQSDCYICGIVASVNVTKTGSGRDSCRIVLKGMGDYLLIVMEYGKNALDKLNKLTETVPVGKIIVAKGKKIDEGRKFVIGRCDLIKVLDVT
jgi:DNA polymerase-3 subunit alpha